MNEQMIELYKQAQEFAYKNISKEYWNTDNFHAVVSGKFAELIVRECAVYCEGHILPKGMAEEDNLDYNDGVMDCARGLKTIFGIE
jgi:hypothetical protein